MAPPMRIYIKRNAGSRQHFFYTETKNVYSFLLKFLNFNQIASGVYYTRKKVAGFGTKGLFLSIIEL